MIPAQVAAAQNRKPEENALTRILKRQSISQAQENIRQAKTAYGPPKPAPKNNPNQLLGILGMSDEQETAHQKLARTPNTWQNDMGAFDRMHGKDHSARELFRSFTFIVRTEQSVQPKRANEMIRNALAKIQRGDMSGFQEFIEQQKGKRAVRARQELIAKRAAEANDPRIAMAEALDGDPALAGVDPESGAAAAFRYFAKQPGIDTDSDAMLFLRGMDFFSSAATAGRVYGGDDRTFDELDEGEQWVDIVGNLLPNMILGTKVGAAQKAATMGTKIGLGVASGAGLDLPSLAVGINDAGGVKPFAEIMAKNTADALNPKSKMSPPQRFQTLFVAGALVLGSAAGASVFLKKGGKVAQTAREFTSWYEDQKAERRAARQLADQADQAVEAAAGVTGNTTGPVSPASGLVIRQGQVSTPGRERAATRLEVRSMDDLIPSSRPDGSPDPRFNSALNDSQNRDRGGAAQVERIRQRAMNPDLDELLEESPYVDRGIPTVEAGGMGVAGHGRLAILNLMRERNPQAFAEYQRRLVERYPDAAGIKDPVLVHVLEDSSPENITRIGRTSNYSNADKMSTIEEAKVNAALLPDGIEDRFRMGSARTLSDAAKLRENQTLVESWIQMLPDAERAAARGLDGAGISEEYLGRFGQALLLKALGPDLEGSLSKLMVDGEGPKRILGGLERAAGDLLELEGAGRRGETEMAGEMKALLGDAMGMVESAYASKMKPAEWFEQASFDDQRMAAKRLGKALVTAGSKERVSEIVSGLARAAKDASGGMFADEMAFKTIDEVVDAALGDQVVAKPARPARSRAAKKGQDTDVQSRVQASTKDALPDLLKRRTRPKVAPLPRPKGWDKGPSQIVLDLQKLIGKRVMVGRPDAKAALGTFRPSDTRTVIRYAGDLDTTSHEIGHALDHAYQLLDSLPDGRAKVELLELGEVTTPAGKNARYQLGEGVAEFIAGLVHNPDEMRRIAPEFSAHFDKRVPATTRAKIKEFSDDVRIWSGLPAKDKVSSNIRTTQKESGFDVQEYFSPRFGPILGGNYQTPMWAKVSRHLFDRLAPIEAAEKALKDALKLDAPNLQPTNRARDLQYIMGRVEAMLEGGVVDESGKAVTPPLRAIFDELPSNVAARAEGGKPSLKDMEADARDLGSLMVSQRTLEKASQFIEDAKAEARTVLLGQAEKFLPKMAKKVRESYDEAVLAGDAKKAAKIVEQVDPESKALDYIERAIDPSDHSLVKSAELRSERISGIGAGEEADPDVAAKAIDELRADPERFAQLEKAAARYREIANGILDYGVRAGRWSTEWADAIKARNEQYVAMKRVLESGENVAAAPPRGGLGQTKEPIKAFKGSTREIENPIASLVEQMAEVVMEADRNRVMRDFRDLILQGSGKQDVDLTSLGAKVPDGEEGAVKIWVDGKPEYWKFETYLQKALTSPVILDKPDWYSAIFVASANLIRNAAVSNPVFAIKNFQRDFQSRVILSPTKGKAKNFWRLPSKGESLDMKLLGAGSFQRRYFDGPANWYDVQARVMAESAGRRVLIRPGPEGIKDVWDWWNRFLNTAETQNRVAEFRNAYEANLANGMDEYTAKVEAARSARGLIDFMQGGETVRKINRVIPFLNASIQGMVAAGRMIRKDPKRFAAKMAIYAGIGIMAEKGWNESVPGGREAHAQLAPHEKDLNWNFWIPGLEVFFSIPKPFEVGTVVSGLARAADRGIAKSTKDKENADRAFEGYLNSLWKGFMPMDTDQFVAFGGGSPVLEMQVNRSLFRDRSIIPPNEEKLDLSLRKGKERASELGEKLSMGKMDPRMVDHLIEGYLSRWGRGLTYGSDTLAGKNPEATDPVILFIQATGLARPAPGYGSRDVQWVLDKATSVGVREVLKDEIDVLFRAADKGDRKAEDAARRTLLARARGVRRIIERAQPRGPLAVKEALKSYTRDN